MAVKQATGAMITAEMLHKERKFSAAAYGMKQDGNPVENTKAINRAIEDAAAAGGGTVIIPEGEYRTYTIMLKSNVNLHLKKGAVIRAAKTDIHHSYEIQEGEGGTYQEPEVNLYAGIQDHGHSYFANSLVYGADLENIRIDGAGRFDGSRIEDGILTYVLMGGDPLEPEYREQRGHQGEWFGNKGIALVRCKNVVLQNFAFVIGGHFAIIAEGVKNLLVDGITVDTTRDAFDIDCCQNVTVRNSRFNSLTDDALVMKASYGAGLFMPTKNVLIEDCQVSGYDAGSVYAGRYTRDKLIATDRGGPTGRVKLGTESTCGYEQVTVRRVRFERSRGFALEAVDGSDLGHILLEDCEMDNISSSPIFIRAGERGRFPVTGFQKEGKITADEPDIRMDDRNWVLPDVEGYSSYPAKRFTPSYNRNTEVSVDGHSFFSIVDPENPARQNPKTVKRIQDNWYPVKYDEDSKSYAVDFEKPLEEWETVLYANGNGSEHFPRVHDIEIRRVKITNADPRYPILLMGLADSRMEHVVISDLEVEYRGGLKMEHAVEQRQLNTNRVYAQFGTKPSVQTLPWLVNTFFLKHEGLLPRAQWDSAHSSWIPNPYLIPELPQVYPEPENWGILPAYGLYARHVKGLKLSRIKMSYRIEDERHPIVLDDIKGAELSEIEADHMKETEELAVVTNLFSRPTNQEYIKHMPYRTTTVQELKIPEDWKVKDVILSAPAPGTPQDEYYSYPTIPIPKNGYHYDIPTDEYPLPLTVYRPFFEPIERTRFKIGTPIAIFLKTHHPACETTMEETDGKIYNESVGKKEYVVKGTKRQVEIRVEGLPRGAVFETEKSCICWMPDETQRGRYHFCAIADDGVMTERMEIEIEIL